MFGSSGKQSYALSRAESDQIENNLQGCSCENRKSATHFSNTLSFVYAMLRLVETRYHCICLPANAAVWR